MLQVKRGDDSVNLESKLDEWLEGLKEEEKEENTLKKYRVNVISFLKFLDGKDLSKDIYKEFIKKLDIVDKYLPSTSNSYIIAINKFLKWLGHPEYTIKQLKLQRNSSINEYMSLTDCKRLLRIAKKNNKMEEYYIIEILRKTGIRISELKYFTVENLSTQIIVRNKGKIRNIPVVADLVRDLKKYTKVKKIESGTIFPNPKTGNLYHTSTIWRRLKKIAGQARVNKKNVHAHSFRHLFAKMYLEIYPGDIAGLADILGHNSLETTRIYTRDSNKEKELKIRRMKF